MPMLAEARKMRMRKRLEEWCKGIGNVSYLTFEEFGKQKVARGAVFLGKLRGMLFRTWRNKTCSLKAVPTVIVEFRSCPRSTLVKLFPMAGIRLRARERSFLASRRSRRAVCHAGFPVSN
jgi:hypothetical protein